MKEIGVPRRETRLRNAALAAAAWLTLVAVGLGDGWVALGLAIVTAALLVLASRGYDPERPLFVTSEPFAHPVGSMWRRYRVTSIEETDDPGLWLVRGERVW